MRRLRDVLTTRGRAFVAAGGTLVVCGLGLGFTDLTRIGVLLLALPLVSGTVMRRHRLRLALDRTTTPSRVRIDETSNVTLSIENLASGRTPLLMAEEQVDYALGDRPRFVVPSMRRGERRQVHYSVRSHARGRHRLGPLAVRLRDPFGLSTRLAAVGGTAEVVVLPRVEPLGPGRPPGSGIGAEGAIPHMVALHGDDDVSVREYRDGDDLRRIHWRATARTGDLMVRAEDRPAQRRAVVLLDSRSEAHRGGGNTGSMEWAVTACASVTALLIEQRYAVHLITAESVEQGLAGDAVALEDALDLLAVAEPSRTAEFTDMVHAAYPVTGAGGLVVAVLGPLEESSARRIAAMRQPGDAGLAMVLDAGSFLPSGPGSSAAPGDAALATAQVLRSAGWAALVVSAGSSLPAVWGALAGAGRPVVV